MPPKKTVKQKKSQKAQQKQEFMSAVAKRPAAGHVAVDDAVDPVEARAQVVDSRRAMATQMFTPEALGMKSTKRMPTTAGMKTVFAAEAAHDVARRIKDAVRPLCLEGEQHQLGTSPYARAGEMRAMMPRRPAWSYDMSSGRLHFREAKAFQHWLGDVRARIQERGGYAPVFEQNLQVWRQLWRVLERAEVVVAVLDVRNPLLHLPPALYHHVTHTLNKPLVCLLNKMDLAPRGAAQAWAAHLRATLPGVAAVVGFQCVSDQASSEHSAQLPQDPSSGEETAQSSPAARGGGELDGEGDALPVGKRALLEACHRAARAHRSAASKGAGASGEAEDEDLGDVDQDEPGDDGGEGSDAAEATRALEVEMLIQEMQAMEAAKANGARLMLGLVGHPNVGKSSVLNSLVGHKAVAVKNTPGHTKILQTYILDDTTCLCDSPGVVFPRLEVPLEAQIVAGLVPLAQVREPFTAVRWLAENAGHNPLPSVLNIKPVVNRDTEMVKMHPADPRTLEVEQGGALPWSPLSICSQYARLRGFVRNDHPDVIKAGMTILRRVLDMRLPYSVPAPAAPTEDAVGVVANDCHTTKDDDSVSDSSYNSADEEEDQQPQSLFFAGMSQEAREQWGSMDD